MWSLTAAALLLFAQTTDFSAEGLKALEAKNYEAAAQLFAKAVEADPKDYSALFHLALAHSMLGKDAEAVAQYKKVLELKPGLYEAGLNLGILLLRQKQPREAAAFLEAAANKKPRELRPRLHLAQALFEAGEFPGAEQAYRAATELDPASALAQLGLAKALARQNRLDGAGPHFRRAAELDAGFKDALFELAALYEKNGQAAEAMAVYQQFPDHAAARERLGQLLVEAERPAEAIPHLEWVVSKSPSAASRLALALAYKKNKQPERALPVLQQAVEAEPANLDLRLMYGRSLRDEKKFAEAAREFLQYVRARPDSIDGWNELAAMLISLEQYPQALAALDRVSALGGETAGHLYLRAVILDRVKDYKNALAAYERFLAAGQGKNPDEEFKARQRIRVIRKELSRR
ncbi:MAG: tetratricopeptide repeat protein [Acidobacteriota bacterium]